MNTPYVKSFNDKGELINTITKNSPYLSLSDNRRQRRDARPTKNFIGNGKQFPITISGPNKFLRMIQVIPDTGKKIYHYILRSKI